MKTAFVDTDVFIRYLTDDDREKADRVEALLSRAAKGEIRLVTTELVIAEVVRVLESSYGLKSTDIAPMIRAIPATPGIEVVNGHLVRQALDHYPSRNIDFVVGYIAALMASKKITDVFAFDRRHMARITGLSRREP